jgi:branched-chain amino acid transport system substrate-binding protein
MQRNFLKAMLCAVGTLALASSAFAGDAVKVGVSQPLTGAFAADGNYVAQGAKLAAEAINKAGGVDGKQIQLIVEDNKSNPTEAAATAERLIVEDKVPVMLGAWGSSLTLAVMPKLLEYKVPMVVETSSSGKITTSGNPYIFRISPTSEMEAKAFAPLVKSMGIKKAAFLATNDDFGKGSMQEFTKMLKANGVEIGASETMGEDATDLSAQLAKIKASGGDTIFVTTDVKQLTLILKQAKDQQVTARIITTGGSVSPDQLIEQAGDAANGSYHLVFFTPWFPDAVKNPEVAKAFMDAWKGANYDVGGLTEGFRGWDGVYTIAAALKDDGGKADSESLTKALWGVQVKGVNGDIAFIKQGPAGKESGQSVPSVYLVKIEGGKVVKQ